MTGIGETTECLADGHDPMAAVRTLQARMQHRFDDVLRDDLRIERGDSTDYAAVRRFHYRSAHPGAIADITRLVHREVTVVGRYLQRRGTEQQTVGVLVRSLPALSCAKAARTCAMI